MAETTKIQWADATWNPWIGCTKVSPGCKNCYAENTTRARVLRAEGKETWGKGAARQRTSAAYWRQPFRWQDEYLRELNDYNSLSINGQQHCSPPRRPRVFPSLCDWLDGDVPTEWLADFLKLIHDTPHLDWLLLTKRPESAMEHLAEALRFCCFNASKYMNPPGLMDWLFDWHQGKAPTNVWIGVSVENQKTADERIPQLLEIPAIVRFLSVEPLLEQVDLLYAAFNGSDPLESMHGIDWVIVGGESGPNARPCDVAWVEGIIGQCKASRVPCFVKQLGQKSYRCGVSGIGSPDGDQYIHPIGLKDKKGGDILEWPVDLRVREFPRT